ncbi:subtilase [Prevotella sp.]|uniref:subtilase n=1 Tax=Prevotella sp. TaxID=59823 RepID=UPI003AB17BC0
MKNKAFCALLAVALSGSVACADTGQTVRVNGSIIDKFVTELTFSGDNVTMTFSDGTQTEDMSLVTIDLTYNDDTTTGVYEFGGKKTEDNLRVYNLNGQYVGNSLEGLAKGVYLVNGKKVVKK